MSGEKDLDQLKREAAEKAKAAALAKRKAKEAGETAAAAPKQESEPEAPKQASTSGADDADLAKKKAAAAAKAKAAALAKKKREGIADEEPASEAPVVETAAETPAAELSGDSDDLAKKKAAAVAKAKAAAAAKRKAMELAGDAPAEEAADAGDTDDLAKKKAAAVAKAKAAAAAKRKAMELSGEAPAEEAADAGDTDDLAKKKAAAVAKAKAAAAAKAKAKAGGADDAAGADDEKAKAIAAAKAKAKAAAAAKAKAAGKAVDSSAEEAPAAPSANQPFLDKYRKVIEENLGADVLEDSYINKLSKDVPTLVAKRDTYFKLAQFLKYNELLGFDYLSELHGTDFETHMEVYVHLYSYKNRQSVALKVKIDRDEPTIESLQPIWAGADWPECEAYDLLGIKFTGHPNLHRIMLGEDWVGHPLRKDYEPYDVEV
jgi:NADH-quinone oxidoreductase subunit C